PRAARRFSTAWTPRISIASPTTSRCSSPTPESPTSAHPSRSTGASTCASARTAFRASTCRRPGCRSSWRSAPASRSSGGRSALTRVGDPSPLDVGERLAQNAEAILEAERDGSYRRFGEAHREPDEPTLDNLTLQTWLLARNRSLHARWLGDQEGLGDLAERF